MTANTPTTVTTRRPWYRPSLTTQIFIGLSVGGLIGYIRPDWGNAVYFLRDIFLNLIKSIIGPLVFSTIVDTGRPIVRAMERLSQVMFKFTNYVMMFAPIGVRAAMAHTVATQGLGVLVNLGNLILSLYLALVIVIVLVFGAVIVIAKVPLRQFVRAVREPAVIAFATTSSESALPKAMQPMERLGVPRHIIGFVMPTGYSFNLVGSTLYLAMASVFIAQAAETTMGWHMTFGAQLTMMITFMLTSKGVAGVPRAALVILLATVTNYLPVGLAPIVVAGLFVVGVLLDFRWLSL